MLKAWYQAHKRLVTRAGAGLVAFAALAWYLRSGPASITHTLKIGFQNSAPYHFPDARGNARGPAVDMIGEAARRQHIDLQWVFSPEGPEVALESGKVDLWPILGDLPDRRRSMYISPPWLKMTYVLLSPESLGIKRPEDLGSDTVAAAKSSLATRIAPRYFRISNIAQ